MVAMMLNLLTYSHLCLQLEQYNPHIHQTGEDLYVQNQLL
jgi:hypothetical protein